MAALSSGFLRLTLGPTAVLGNPKRPSSAHAEFVARKGSAVGSESGQVPQPLGMIPLNVIQ